MPLEVRDEPFLCEAVRDLLVVDAWHWSRSGDTVGTEDPGTVPASANGRGYAFPGRPRPAPLMAPLDTPIVNIETGQDRMKATVRGGFLQILNNAVTLVVDEATLEED